MTTPKYKTKWKTKTLNKSFWNEVLVGRSIIALTWDKEKITGLVLDNCERVTITTAINKKNKSVGTLCIQVDDRHS